MIIILLTSSVGLLIGTIDQTVAITAK